MATNHDENLLNIGSLNNIIHTYSLKTIELCKPSKENKIKWMKHLQKFSLATDYIDTVNSINQMLTHKYTPQIAKFIGANMGPTWVLSAPDGPHVGPMNLAISDMSLNVDITGSSWESRMWKFEVGMGSHSEHIGNSTYTVFNSSPDAHLLCNSTPCTCEVSWIVNAGHRQTGNQSYIWWWIPGQGAEMSVTK